MTCFVTTRSNANSGLLLFVLSLATMTKAACATSGSNRVHACPRQASGFGFPSCISHCRGRCAPWNKAAICCTENLTNTQTRSMHTFALQSSENDESDGKTVDDYVLNVHGGKYRFDDPSAVGTAAGSDFAESLYSSSSSSLAEKDEEAAASAYEVWPNWSKRMASITALPGLVQNLRVPASGEVVSVKIKNEYRTWEPYYARIIHLSGDNSAEEAPAPPYEIVGKIHGKLAPQGGSSNLCDENDPYSDTKCISIRCGTGSIIDGDWCLSVGTEEEQWYYRLVLESGEETF